MRHLLFSVMKNCDLNYYKRRAKSSLDGRNFHDITRLYKAQLTQLMSLKESPITRNFPFQLKEPACVCISAFLCFF